MAMSAQRKRQRSVDSVKQNEERSSGVYLVSPVGRVARRGSTRVETSSPAEPTFPGRGRSHRGDT
jgi:hypothetical protein